MLVQVGATVTNILATLWCNTSERVSVYIPVSKAIKPCPQKTNTKHDVINDYMYRLNNLSLRFHNNIKYLFTLFYHACIPKIICHVMEGYEPISTILIAQVVLLHVYHFINGSGWTTKSNIQVIQVNSLDEI